MNAERLLAYYGTISDTSNAIPRLRRFILDLAVRGKLVASGSRATNQHRQLLQQIVAEQACGW